MKKSKPLPPVDLWEQLGQARGSIKTIDRPIGGFTRAEYMARFNLTRHSTVRELKVLEESGKVKVHRGSNPSVVYYTFVKR